MTASQFKEIWTSKYNLTPPISYHLRYAFPERWFRIHSLPESKRYPENDSEWGILLNRQNSLIGDLLGKDSDILVVTGEYDINSNGEHKWTFSPIESVWTCNKILDKSLSNMLQLPIIIVERGKIA